jgi:carbamoyl-phosphate synthase small subunit
MVAKAKKGILALESGKYFIGESFGADGETFGEIVFNTSLSGYQEILTDPSYCGQIICMTYPHIGNYGMNQQDCESRKPFASGFVVREASSIVSNWRSEESLQDFLMRYSIVAIDNIDTRSLTRHIRQAGAMKAVISTLDLDPKSLVKKAKSSQGLVGRDLVKEVTCRESYLFNKRKASACKYKIAVLDCGCKSSILEQLELRGCEVTVFPATASFEEILEYKPSGVLLSNGPGDPAAVTYVIETVKKLIAQMKKSEKKVPIFGICLGHQMLGLALGAKTYKLKFGHRGANHPVKDLVTGKIEITAQNHGFCVDPKTLEDKNVDITHKNLYDKTLEGFKHKELPIFCVQYHPEAGPGPHDPHYLFDRFMELMKKHA